MVDVSANSGAKKRAVYSRVRGSVGAQRGYLLARRNKKSGQFSASKQDAPINVAAYKWPSVERYSRLSAKSGLAELLRELSGFMKHLEFESPKVVHNAFLPAFNKSLVYCPTTLPGPPSKGSPIHLRESARLKVEAAGTSGGGRYTATISYGHAGNPFYAVFVHEIMKYRHAPPTRAKFLEVAIKEKKSEIENALIRGSRAVITGSKV